MRPFRAVAGVALVVAFYGGMRAAAIRDEVARRFEPLVLAPTGPSRVSAAPFARSLPPVAEATPPAPVIARTPEVMVYSYPALSVDGGPSRPRAMWRLRGRRVVASTSETGEPASATVQPPPPARTMALRTERPTPPRASEPPPDMSAAAYDAATRGYAYLRVGDRRAAASAFAVALSLDPAHPRAHTWAAEKNRLARWWRVEAYVFHRDGGTGYADIARRVPGLPAATNILGGGSGSTMIALTPNPLSRHPIEVQARYAAPYTDWTHLDAGRAQVALGVALRPIPKVPVTLVAERLFKAGYLARSDWQLRAYGGTSRRIRGIDLSFFGEAGVIGRRPDRFAGAQLIAERQVQLPGKVDLGLGVGAWGAVQTTDRTTDRLDVGPTLRLSREKVPMQLRVEYRRHVAGNAQPGSGLALTVSAAY